ncbi:MAG: NAD(P)/FAD-dependent oxidoreductase [Chitinophagaceae bacterium]|nr:NAD(P)/FAD-dependent oxidoreductase [Chitinophagaceae bacterium]MDP1762278.1 NAD(P)/FAD-dependent oxidoreductase [Sediminibacterium sp.]MDP3666027.1 NAD(P)/FAD-dependent oxidoreductase [Sediminibacterium sp.]
MQKQLVVIGGGAAGFFCAVNAARMNPQLKVTIIEKSNKLLAKVKVSGGGRCNITHACFDIPGLVKRYPRGQNFVKKAFHWFSPNDTIDWFAERGVELKAEADGRMFPVTNNSQTIINCLLKESDKYKVEILMQSEVTSIAPGDNGFILQTSNSQLLTPNYICIASGGYPKSTMFNWLRNLGHTIEEPVPSLFTFNMPDNPITELMGVSVDRAVVKIAGSKLTAEGPLLITHWGMSGPAILRLSAWGARQLADADYQFSLLVNWLPDYQEQNLRADWLSFRDAYAGQKLSGKNPFGLPNRLWVFLLVSSGIHPDIRWADLPSKEQNRLIKNLTAQAFPVNGKTTFKEEFVTCGGVKLSEIDPNSMQSKIQPGIFFAGEVMDVDGITGGFNFQHAWTSGWIAGKSIAAYQEN